jgi:hypothetical protein
MNKAHRCAARRQNTLPPFDLLFCRDDPDQEIVFVLGSESVKESVQRLFPDLLLDKHELGWVGCVTRDWALLLAFEAAKAGLRVGFGENGDGKLDLRPVKVVEMPHAGRRGMAGRGASKRYP